MSPDSAPDDEAYAENEEGDSRQTEPSPDGEDRYRGYPEKISRAANPKVYVGLLLLGAGLFLFPEPVTSAVGLPLVVAGALVAAVDVLG